MITLDHVTRRYAGFLALDDVTLTVADGEILVLIGASGSGKSTLLQLINRLQDPTSGTVRVDGEDIANVAPEQLRRRMGYVIQGGGLFPHWTVARNIATVPRLLGWDRARIAARVEELLDLLRLDGARLRDAYPHMLSGGQQQRVGVARALAANPSILLMDEPFGALDPVTRAELQGEIRRIHVETGCTIVFVTHDMDEALGLATRIAVIDRGRLVQLGTPLDLLTRPATEQVAQFIGTTNRGLKLLGVQRVADRVHPDETVPGEPIGSDLPLSSALSTMVIRGQDRLSVRDPAGLPLGAIHLSDLVRPL
ncbi:MAG: ABC transporter ATP-binding protein [Pseudomonadota bacterium]|nr:ABC transporter ATP-binding protein [Pseudomonadota bacterium]